jgi:hypothetical protein
MEDEFREKASEKDQLHKVELGGPEQGTTIGYSKDANRE